MSDSANDREVRRQSRFDTLTSTDPQLVAARPDPAVSAALDAPGMLLSASGPGRSPPGEAWRQARRPVHLDL